MQTSTFLYYRLILLFIVGLCNAHTLFGQQEIKFRKYTVDDGLPNNIGYKMFQDSKGYLWVGTDNGLGRFDGKDWKIYNTEDGLSSPFPIAMQEAEDGALWISSWKGGLDILQGDSISHVNVEGGDIKINGLNLINNHEVLVWNFSTISKYQKHADGKWRSSGNYTPRLDSNNKFCLKPREDLADTRILLSSHEVAVSAISNQRTLIYGLFSGVYECKKNFNIELFFEAPSKKDTIYGFFEAPDKALWFTSKQKIYKLDESGQTQTFSKGLPNERIYSINVVANKYAYIITGDVRYRSSKLYYYDFTTEKSLLLNDILGLESQPAHMIQDAELNVWLTTDGVGLYCLYPSLFRHYGKKDGLVHSFVNTVESTSKEGVLVGTKNGLFTLQNDFFGKEKLYGRIPGRHHDDNLFTITDVLVSHNNPEKIWAVGTNIGISKTNEHFYFNDSVVGGDRLMHDDDGVMLIQTSINNLKALYPIKGLEPYKDNNAPECFYACYWYRFSGEIQFGEAYHTKKRKLYLLEYQADEQQSLYRFGQDYEKKLIFSQFPSKRVNSIYEDMDYNLWVGTDNGLYWLRKKPDGSGYELGWHYTEADGLISKRCRKLLMDDNGLLWIGTPHGLMYFNGKQFTTYTSKTGLIDNTITALHLDYEKNLWVGTGHGVSKMNISEKPNIIRAPLPAPVLNLEKISVNGSDFSIASVPSQFEYNTELSFYFKAVTFLYPEKLQYQYQLNEGKWVSIQDNALTFSLLQPGVYRLQLRVKKLNSNWCEPVVFTFKILSPWWFTWWAICLYIIVLVSLFLGVMAIQRKRIKLKEEERIRINKTFTELELKALQAQMNPHFIFNALNSIQGFILDSDELKANDYLSSFSQLMRMYLESSKSKYISVGQEVKLLALYIELESLRFGDRLTFSIDADPLITNEEYKIPGMLVQPYVENAINHGLSYKKESGTLNVSFIKEPDCICCIVEDDGVGRKKALEIRQKMKKQHRSRAMQIVDERLVALNSMDKVEVNIVVEDKKDEHGEGAGTKVIIKFPIIKDTSSLNM